MDGVGPERRGWGQRGEEDEMVCDYLIFSLTFLEAIILHLLGLKFPRRILWRSHDIYNMHVMRGVCVHVHVTCVYVHVTCVHVAVTGRK